MQEDEESISISNEDISVQSDTRAFSQNELVKCESCQRANPPTRTGCLYCGAALPITEAAVTLAKPTLRPLESWEQGFNAVLLPGKYDSSALTLKKVSDLLRLDIENLKVVMESGRLMPLARSSSHAEAALVQTRLNEFGLNTLIVSDTELDSFPPVRIRTLDLKDESLVVFPAGPVDAQSILWRDITLMVAGRRLSRRLEIAERPDRKRGKEIVDSRELSSDSERLDIYSRGEKAAWRIAADNFDFSCLREMKSLIVSKNFQTLVSVLRERAKFADFDDSYVRVRQSLNLVWPLEEHTESMGLRKPRMGRVNTSAVTISDNEMQIARYSQLLNFIRLREADPIA